MARLRHMSLPDRKAAALQAMLQELTREIDNPDPVLEAFVDNIKKFSKRTTVRRDTGRLDTFLIGALEQIEKLTRIECNDNIDSITWLIDEMKSQCADIKCEICLNGKICTNTLDDVEIITSPSGGKCIDFISKRFEKAREITKSIYNSLHQIELTDVDVRLETISLQQSPPAAIPGRRLAINASTRYEDAGDEKASHIEIRLCPPELNREALAALPYLMLHEVFCHCYQMRAHAERRPNKKGTADPISEGMADEIVVDLLELHADSFADAKERLRATRDATMARSIHLDRASLDRCPPLSRCDYCRIGASLPEAYTNAV